MTLKNKRRRKKDLKTRPLTLVVCRKKIPKGKKRGKKKGAVLRLVRPSAN